MTTSDESFAGRVAVVTGAASGVGRAVALTLRSRGATVICGDLAGGHPAPGPGAGEAVDVQLDVTSQASVTDLAARVRDDHGRVDILVNSAGIFELGAATEVDLDHWARHLDVNLTGTFLCCRALLPLMSTPAAIVNVASIAGLVSIARNAAYSASKGGVVLLTKNLAVDYGPRGVRVNCVCPYSLEGPMMDRYFAVQDDPAASRIAIAARTPLGRLGRLEEVAEVIAFLASTKASYVNGVALPVDGGYAAG